MFSRIDFLFFNRDSLEHTFRIFLEWCRCKHLSMLIFFMYFSNLYLYSIATYTILINAREVLYKILCMVLLLKHFYLSWNIVHIETINTHKRVRVCKVEKHPSERFFIKKKIFSFVHYSIFLYRMLQIAFNLNCKIGFIVLKLLPIKI